MRSVIAAVLTFALLPATAAAAAPATRTSTALSSRALSSTAFSSTVVDGSSCMDVPNGASTNALQLIDYACNGGNNQSFAFTQVSSGVYTIGTLTAGSCVDITGRSTADNAAVIQYTCNGQTNQQFRLQAVSGTTYNVVSVNSGKCVAPAASLVQLPCTSTRVWSIPGAGGGTTTPHTFTNPLDLHGPDPWMTYYNGFYYLATTTWNRTITMRKATTLAGLTSATDTVVFNLTRPNGAGTMWAPEFHLLSGPDGTRWYLYYVAGVEPYDLGTQRIHVLESAGLDPMGPYTFKADMLDPTQDNTWELDPSILQLNGRLYLLGTYYTGSQPMFIRPLANPWTASGTRHLLATPTYGWETVGGAVNEAPEAITHNGKTFIVFSASHCSTPDYKLGLLTYNGGDPLSSSSWVKSAQPIFQRNDANGVFGPGHNGFFTSPDGTEDWMVYHANSSAGGGCDMNRTTRAQKITWNADGTPNLGTPAALGTPLAAPSGEPAA